MKTLEGNIKSKDIEKDNYSNIDINDLLKGNKKIVTFIGASKSGTSFIVNNIAQLLSKRGINIAILDTTYDKNAYYIYTKNQEGLKSIASTSIEDLTYGIANGVRVNDNLTVYTALPGENKNIQKVELILETLLKNHTLVLIDCDFKTPADYFKYATEIYLVQTMDVLTIQPLTEILSEWKNKGILQESKLKIIINKFVKVGGVTEREIIGAMAYYNDPAMAYMKELFNRNAVKYMTIPFEKDIYEKYLGLVAKCDVNLNEYSDAFIRILRELGNEIYP